jgi:hypothetical protein
MVSAIARSHARTRALPPPSSRRRLRRRVHVRHVVGARTSRSSSPSCPPRPPAARASPGCALSNSGVLSALLPRRYHVVLGAGSATMPANLDTGMDEVRVRLVGSA